MAPMVLVLAVGHAAIVMGEGAEHAPVSLSALRDETFILVRRRGAPGMYVNLIAACAQTGPAVVTLTATLVALPGGASIAQGKLQ